MTSFTRLTSEQMETLSEIVFGLTITFSAIQFAFNPPHAHWGHARSRDRVRDQLHDPHLDLADVTVHAVEAPLEG